LNKLSILMTAAAIAVTMGGAAPAFSAAGHDAMSATDSRGPLSRGTNLYHYQRSDTKGNLRQQDALRTQHGPVKSAKDRARDAGVSLNSYNTAVGKAIDKARRENAGR
jgi:hypothetical protein